MKSSRMCRHALLLITVLLVGCGAVTSVSVPVTRPAEVNLKDFDKLAVGEIKGRGSGTLEAMGDFARAVTGGETKKSGAERFTAELVEALHGSERFDVLDIESLKMALSQNNLVMASLTSGGNEKEIKGIFGNIALISGRILRYDYDQELTHKDFKKKDKKTDKVTTTRTYYRDATATVSVSLRIVDLRTSKVLATKKFTKSEGRKKSKRGSRPDRIPSEPLFDACRAEIIRSFVRIVSSYTEHVYVSFETDKEIPELDHGFRMVKLGDWDDARDIFQRVVETYSTSPVVHKAYYNLGLSYMYTDRFDEARTALKKAYSGKPDRKYLQAIGKLDKRIEDTRRLEAQRWVDPDAEESDGEPVEEKSRSDAEEGK